MSEPTYQNMREDAHEHRSSTYNFWTWFIAVVAIIALIWTWLHSNWPNTACCSKAAVTTAAPVATAPLEEHATLAVTEPFSFTAASHVDFEASGNHAGITWFEKIPQLEAWLGSGKDWHVEGNSKHVTITGTVASESIKTQKGDELRAFFGPGVTVDNQLVVEAPLPVVEAAPAAVAEPIVIEQPLATKPDNAKVYFDIGYHALPPDGPSVLTDIVAFAKANPSAKVVISGFHDPSGNQIMNIALSKNRAKSVYRYLVSVGIPEAQIELRKPQSTKGEGSYREARRAEVSIE